jgi:hypothetical protein
MARHKKQDASRRLFKLEIRSSKCGQTSSGFKERRFETADLPGRRLKIAAS